MKKSSYALILTLILGYGGWFGCGSSALDEPFGAIPPSDTQVASYPHMVPPQALASPSPSPLADAIVIAPLPVPQAQGTDAAPGSPGSCIAWSAGYGLGTIMAGLNQGWDINDPANQVSPAYLYSYVLNLEDKSCPIGTADSDYLNYLVQNGSPSIETVPYEPSCKYLGDINLDTPSDPRFKIGSWYYIDPKDRSTIQAVVASGLPVAFACHLYSNFKEYSGDSVFYGTLPFIDDPNGDLAGHGMVVVGYDNSLGDPAQGIGAYRIMNSFGTGWGDGGFMWMSYATFESSAFASYVALPFQSFDAATGTAMSADPASGSPQANLTGAFQFIQPASGGGNPTVYLIFNYAFAEPFLVSSIAVTGPSGNQAATTIGHWQNNAFTFFARDDGSHFPVGTYQVQIQGSTLAGSNVSYTVSIDVAAPAQNPSGLSEADWDESLIGGTGQRGADQ